ncbi:MAG: LysR family transcriptional regulator [Paracoccus denitrificans]|uniref:LysR family transcriptional regulator n=1 Tax=Paracoccus denitrificans TaxID=266 RepID=A0A533IG05_PARDE|nr:MAG: LysR family transcriptional regulator [Paracoccus denitrificans]
MTGTIRQGESYLPHARKVLDALQEAEAALAPAEAGLSGRLRITCGTTLGEVCVAGAVRRFLTENPSMRVDLHLMDGYTDLAAGGFDLAVRIGVPRDSSLRMRRLGETTPRIAASPDYLHRYGIPRRPEDLEKHRAILDLNEDTPSRWQFQDTGGSLMTVPVSGALAVNSASVTIAEAIAGHGLTRAPDIFLAPALASGALVPLLDDYATGSRPIHMLSHPTAFRQHKIAAFAKVMQAELDSIFADRSLRLGKPFATRHNVTP